MMIKNIQGLIALKYLTLGAIALVFTSCRGGSSPNATDIAPQSLDGVSLQISQNQGPTLDFIAGRGQSPGEGGTETGTFSYRVGGQQGFRLQELSAALNDGFFGDNTTLGLLRKWPDDIINGNYRYTPLGGTAGRLEFWGNLTNTIIVSRSTNSNGVIFIEVATLFWGTPTSGDPLIFDISFDDGGTGQIVGASGVLTTPALGDALINPLLEVEIPLNLSAALTAGGPVPSGFTSTFDGPSRIFTGRLSDQPVTLVDAADGTRSIFDFVDNGLTGSFNSDFIEAGTFTMTFDPQGDPLSPNSALAGTYTLEAVEGTDSFLLDIDYTESTNPGVLATGVLQDGVVTLDFGSSSYNRPTSLGLVNGEFTFN